MHDIYQKYQKSLKIIFSKEKKKNSAVGLLTYMPNAIGYINLWL